MFPDQFPAEQIRTLIEIIRSREVINRRAELGYAAWTIQGYAMGQILGQPWVGDALFEALDDDVIPMLEGALAMEENAKGAINWVMVLAWLVRKVLPLFV